MDIRQPELPSEVDDAPTISRKSGRSPQVEVLVRADRRRTWPAERKREIVAESLQQGIHPERRGAVQAATAVASAGLCQFQGRRSASPNTCG